MYALRYGGLDPGPQDVEAKRQFSQLPEVDLL
jgi:hypothetical protein